MQIYPQLLSCSIDNATKSMNETAQIMIKETFKTIKNFKSSRIEGDLIYEIVPNQYVLPKTMSEDKIKTKWEKFAEEKGIKKKTKSRMIYSENLKKWVPRYGSRSEQNLILQGGVVEVDQSISKMINEKKKRIAKNKKNAENNRKRALEIKKVESKNGKK
jgi:regulator of ribosome biosynthesis